MSHIAEGEGRVEVTGGSVWYRVVGGGDSTPLVTLHGGPGYPSVSLEPLAALGVDRPVVFYDQLGCGNSDRPADERLWTVERFVEELTSLLGHLDDSGCHMVVRMGVDTTSDSYDCHGRPLRMQMDKGLANHRDGGCDSTEPGSTVQPANTGRPVETTRRILPQPVMER